ncbi:homogentisate 1,2-dioxygenase [Saccharolobus islandicus]|uniref:Homogentisate 12-dioxygenase n=1 Tax=Saccharolobus islandicus (strain REY15A) TaxID=930945 RepID=F0NDV1_SACI5|nr:homogentisate 1,2-dioxygenase [Sulfolobus islandicus]ADX84660.1 homogentisate 12-dioxygenase [Sulfolobus islandicus REY15A]
MAFYYRQGEVPKKRHTIFMKDNLLLREEVFGLNGFSGRYSLLYHLNPPTRIAKVGEWRNNLIEEWNNAGYRHHKLSTSKLRKSNDVFLDRIPLIFNEDVIISYAKVDEGESKLFYRNADFDEVYYIQEGEAEFRSVFGSIELVQGDYLVIPRGTTYTFNFKRYSELLVIEGKQVEIPRQYRNDYGQLIEGSFYYNRDIKLPNLKTFNEKGDYNLVVKTSEGFQSITLDYHPFDVIGWDGYLYPFALNVYDLEPITGKLHQPPTVYTTFTANNFVICTFVPRLFDYHPNSVPISYYHDNVDADEVLFYSSGQFMSRRGISKGDITLHRGGHVHGPQPGAVESSLSKRGSYNDEVAVMVETQRRVKLTNYAKEVDDPSYPLSWYIP